MRAHHLAKLKRQWAQTYGIQSSDGNNEPGNALGAC